MKNYIYKEFCSTVQDRGRLVPYQNIKDEHNLKEEGYQSIYLFDETALEYVRQNQTIAGFDGSVWIDKIPIDIDKPDVDLVAKVLSILEDYRVDIDTEIEIWFSGRGFHIMIPVELFEGFEASSYLPDVVKSTIRHIFKDVIDEIDLSVYDKLRIFRLPYSINKKSGLYKTRLDLVDLSSIEEVKEQAVDVNVTPELDIDIIYPKLPIVENFEVPSRRQVEIVPEIKKFHCIHNMIEYPREGARHNTLMRIASHFKREGYSSNTTTNFLYGWGGLNPPEIEKVTHDIYTGSYCYSCKDDIMSDHCHPDCIFYGQFKSVYGAEESALQLSDSLDSSLVKLNLKPWMGLVEDFIIEGGELVTFVGRTGSGKSAFVQNVLENTSQPTLYLSLEMSARQCYRRALQIHYGMDKSSVIREMLKNKRFGVDALSHIYYSNKSCTVFELGKLIDSMNPRPKIVVVDHYLLMKSKTSGEYEKITEILGSLKQLALSEKVIILGISQVSREEARKDSLGTYSGKGSGAIENDSDKVIACDRDQKSDRMRVHCEKDREGQALDVNLHFVGDLMRVHP